VGTARSVRSPLARGLCGIAGLLLVGLPPRPVYPADAVRAGRAGFGPADGPPDFYKEPVYRMCAAGVRYANPVYVRCSFRWLHSPAPLLVGCLPARPPIIAFAGEFLKKSRHLRRRWGG
jgi:hypothetical protein